MIWNYLIQMMNGLFYLSFEELRRMGYGFMVKDHYPLIEKNMLW